MAKTDGSKKKTLTKTKSKTQTNGKKKGVKPKATTNAKAKTTAKAKPKATKTTAKAKPKAKPKATPKATKTTASKSASKSKRVTKVAKAKATKAKPKAKPKANAKTTKSKAKPKAKRTKKVSKAAKAIRGAMDDDSESVENSDASSEPLYEVESSESDNDTELSENSSNEIEAEPEIEIKEYEMDEYEKNQAGTKRHNLLREILLNTFGYKSFKPEQYKIIDHIMDGRDVLGIMPTGYGKSLCFQIPPLATNELSIVISPLIALMDDQQESMTKIGIRSCVYNSTVDAKAKKEMEDELIQGQYNILYVTPESLDKPVFRKLLDKVYSEVGICMVAVDEAHCVSAYGFDFRPKYRNIAKVRKYLPDVPILAVTATATEKVAKDISRNLDMANCTEIKTSFDRPNIFINIKQIRQKSMDKICELIRSARAKRGSAIIYCVTKKDTDRLNREFNTNGIKSAAYHAGLTTKQRTTAQEKFMQGKVDCICATVAFGMGINKANVRLVVHYGCPKNIESYYQEIGRAGRDGKDAECWMFYRQSDFRIQNLLIEKITDPVYKTTCRKLMYIMTKYITDKKCRRKELLKYFSEEYPKTNCGKCDNCCSVTKAINRKDEGDLFKLLSTVFELESVHNYSVGKNKLMLIMRGSNAKSITPTLKSLPYYGALSSKKKATVTNLLETAIELGYIENVHARPGDMFMVLTCTEYGLAFGQEYEKKLNKVSRNVEAGTSRIRIV